MIHRHQRIGEACRKTIVQCGLKLHLNSGFSNTVTVFDVPIQTSANRILEIMKNKHGILLAGSFGELSNKVIRIGHMGVNANVEDMKETMGALNDTLKELGVSLKADMKETFMKYI